MKIKLKRDASHRVNSAKSINYRAGQEYSVPKVIGEALIAKGEAEAIPGAKTVDKETN